MHPSSVLDSDPRSASLLQCCRIYQPLQQLRFLQSWAQMMQIRAWQKPQKRFSGSPKAQVRESSAQ